MSQRGGPPSRTGGPSGRSRTGSVGNNPGSPSVGAPSTGPGPSGTSTPFPRGTGRDPARLEPPKRQDEKFNRNIDLPPEAYMKKPTDARFAVRPSFNTHPQGKNIQVEVNQFSMKDFGNTSVFQHDMAVMPVPHNVGAVTKKLLNHPRVKNEIRRAFGNAANYIIHDGRKLAWTTTPLKDDIRVRVDLDEGSGRDRQDNIFMFQMRTTTKIDLSHIKTYLAGKSAWDNALLEGMNFLDHVLRQHPSENLVMIKRNFYHENEPKKPLDTVVEVAIGAYASIRMNMPGQNSIGLGINVDVANTAMWAPKMLPQLIRCYLDIVEKQRIPSDHLLGGPLAPIRGKDSGTGQPRWIKSPTFQILKRLYRLKFDCPHQQLPKSGKRQVHTFKELAFNSGYGQDGLTARTYKFDYKGKTISLEEYFSVRYQIRLQCANLPLVATNKKDTYFPMELCRIVPNQRYQYKLTGDQTSSMIKIAVTRPQERKAKIMEKHAMLNWQQDPYLKAFGISVETNFTKAPARVLKAPTIEFGQRKTVSPGTSGRWNIQNIKFYNPSVRPLRYWGFVWVEGNLNRGDVERFAKQFINIYRSHGGIVANENPRIWDEGRSQNPAESIDRCQRQLLMDSGGPDNPPDMIFVIFQFRNSNGYQRVKKTADCRYGIITQCLQANHIKKNNPQYHSNVAMKVNAKMGGSTNRIPNSAGDRNPFFKSPTIIMGADVSHGTPGIAASPSVASFVCSVDDNASRYVAAAETNGWNEEIIMEKNLRSFISRLMPSWGRHHPNGTLPQNVIYFRDGVSEGQFAYVVAQESHAIKNILKQRIPNLRMTTIVATKRHHIRMFPPRGPMGDRNGNPLPGTLLEKDVTHPFHWDFYLCSHVAIQGTARPVHYHVLEDEIGWSPNELQQMIYEQCYTYARATTPVSIHPAIYYAHLASGRARVHENVSTTEGPRTGPKAVEHSIHKQANVDDHDLENISSSDLRKTEMPQALLSLGGTNSNDAAPKNTAFFRGTMWFI